MNVTLCDLDDCDREASIHLKVIDGSSDWFGMEADLCGNHDCLGVLIEQWERDLEAKAS